jgi:hypothetical protein
MQLSRRSLITGLVSFVAAPAIVRASSIMPVKAWAKPIFHVGQWQGVTFADLEYDERFCAAVTRGLNGLIPGPGYIGDFEVFSTGPALITAQS